MKAKNKNEWMEKIYKDEEEENNWCNKKQHQHTATSSTQHNNGSSSSNSKNNIYIFEVIVAFRNKKEEEKRKRAANLEKHEWKKRKRERERGKEGNCILRENWVESSNYVCVLHINLDVFCCCCCSYCLLFRLLLYYKPIWPFVQQRYNNYSNSSSSSPILIFLRSLFQFKIFFICSVFAFDRVVVVIRWISFVHCCCCCFCFSFILKSTTLHCKF